MSNILRSKCAVVGDCTVGKSALIQMFLSDGRNFLKNYNMTCGVELNIKSITIPDTSATVELFLYDSSGRDLYLESLPKYWNEPNMVFAVYDVTSEASFNSVNRWVSMVRDYVPIRGASSAPGVLFANKIDLLERRSVSPKAGAALAEKLGLHYFEGSAKEYSGVEEPFFLLSYEWHKLLTEKRKQFNLIG
ncbi:intraflagellar transport protein 27 homolog [Anabrus simplex]|uniref:intraflagellar transport protein 27 homolog n=1 Tax=Anabrus simplex TaxID=316456 RepID=UPI0034DD2D14